MNKSHFAKVILGVIVLLALIGIGTYSASNNTSSNGNPEQEIVKIGVSLPLTGKSASIGERVKNAIQLANEEISAAVSTNNGAAQYKLELVIEDDQGESAPTVNTIQKLIQTDKTKIVLGLLKSDPLLAIAPITEKEKIIVMSPTAGADGISAAGDYIFRTIETAIMHGKKGAMLFKNDLGISNVAVFTANASNAQTYSKHFKEQFSQHGGKVVEDISYVNDQIDFKTDISKAIKAKASGIFIGVGTAKEAGIIAKQARELGFKGVIAASVAADAAEFFTAAGNAAEGIYVIASPFDPEANAEAQAFNQAYSAKYSASPDGFAANSYDALKILSNAVNHCKGGSDTNCIRDYIYSLKDYPGAGGTVSFDSNGDVIKEPQVKVAEGGVFKIKR